MEELVLAWALEEEEAPLKAPSAWNLMLERNPPQSYRSPQNPLPGTAPDLEKGLDRMTQRVAAPTLPVPRPPGKQAQSLFLRVRIPQVLADWDPAE